MHGKFYSKKLKEIEKEFDICIPGYLDACRKTAIISLEIE